MRTTILALTVLSAPTLAFAAGTESDTPPTTTETTTICEAGTVWSEDNQKCEAAQESSLSDDLLYEAARELAYAGRYDETLNVLAAMSDPMDDRVLTYKGFVHRKMGDVALGNSYYEQALAANPNNLLARSYMGQGFVTEGRLDDARAQLVEIVARGGTDTWPELALRNAITSGKTYTY